MAIRRKFKTRPVACTASEPVPVGNKYLANYGAGVELEVIPIRKDGAWGYGPTVAIDLRPGVEESQFVKDLIEMIRGLLAGSEDVKSVEVLE